MTPAPSMYSGAHRASEAGDDVDFYPTQPWAARACAELVARVFDPQARTVWECAVGAGHMAHGLAEFFPTVWGSDVCLYDRNLIHDFTSDDPAPFDADWIITNPPFSHLEAFIRRAWMLARRGVALLVPARTLEGVGRHALLYGETPLTAFAPFSERVPMHRGMYDPDRSTAAFYACLFFLKPELRPARFMARAPGLDGAMRLRPAVIDIPPGTRARLFRRSDLAFAVGGAARTVFARLKAEGMSPAAADLDLLAAVAAANGDTGVTSLRGTFDAGRLATLKTMGLLEHAPELRGDDGERRFRPSADGRTLLLEWEGVADG